MRRTINVFATIGSLALLINVPNAAVADAVNQSSIARALASVSNLSDQPGTSLLTELSELTLSGSGTEFVSTTKNGASAHIPRTSKLSIRVKAQSGTTIGLRLPFADSETKGQLIADGVVAFDNQNGSASSVLAKSDGSLQVATVIESSIAPSRYSYEIELPKGAKLVRGSDGNVTFVSSDGKFLGGVAPSWAIDARGATVPTRYDISGSTLTQFVDHKSLAYSYPIVADPWFGLDLIEKTTWSAATLQVFPTIWGRISDTASRWAAWDEVLSKTPGNRENTPSMRDQMYCHVDFVRKVEPTKSSWNLDRDRPYVDYFTLVLNRCNVPKTK